MIGGILVLGVRDHCCSTRLAARTATSRAGSIRAQKVCAFPVCLRRGLDSRAGEAAALCPPWRHEQFEQLPGDAATAGERLPWQWR